MTHISKLPALRRREFLKRASAVSIAGTAAPWALQLAAIGEAAAAAAPGDYKAIVCLFMYGGNDYGNTVIPYDTANYQAYANIRQALAIPRDQLAATALTPSLALPDGRQMALAPTMNRLKSVFDAGRLGVMLNIGPLMQPTTLAQYKAANVPLPPKLFSHNDQSSLWQSSRPEGATSGWGGRLADQFLSSNGNATFSCINVSGNAVFMSGGQAVQYQMSAGGAVAINGANKSLFGSAACAEALRGMITGERQHWMEQELNRVTARSVNAQGTITTALSTSTLQTPFETNGNGLASQLQTVARLIGARASLGVQRQVYFVSIGGFDLHDNLMSQQPVLLGNVASAMASFDAALVELGVSQNVTTFTASDFGRTLSSNGDGSDHGWGSHHLVMGGAVKGGRFYGAAPTVAVNGPDDVGQGRLLPTTSVDQLAATLALWMGVPMADLPGILPGIVNFTQKDLGLFTA
ncbi:Tat pathway signal protein [Roseateles noduli]|nr:Tat pathway signal protein [Roseateles noduli]